MVTDMETRIPWGPTSNPHPALSLGKGEGFSKTLSHLEGDSKIPLPLRGEG
jgi:hypothetical protein